MLSIPERPTSPQVTRDDRGQGVIGGGCAPGVIQARIEPFPDANLSQIIAACFEPLHRAPAYGAIRGWLEGQGDPWLDALSVSDAWWVPAMAAVPPLLWLSEYWDESEVLRAVKDEAAAILRRRQSQVGKGNYGLGRTHPMHLAWFGKESGR